MFVNEGRGDRSLENPMEMGSPHSPALLGQPGARWLDPALHSAAPLPCPRSSSILPQKKRRGCLSDTQSTHAAVGKSLAPGRSGQSAKPGGKTESEWVESSGGGGNEGRPKDPT